jgi:hypothetical protein
MGANARLILRMLDANANRAGEGMRVAEDVLRFSFGERVLSSEARRLRHAIARAVNEMVPRASMISSRDSVNDPGARRFSSGRPRRSAIDLLTANLRRAQESSRVLEECARLHGSGKTVRLLQASRYALYTLEKKIWAKRPWGREGK